MAKMEKLTCPGCGQETEFATWQSLNVSLDPQEKRRLISRELFQFKCPACPVVTDIVYPLLYHDMEQKRMIFLIPDAPDGAQQAAPSGFDESAMTMMAAEGYQFRLVGTQNDLVEKVLIFDAGLDDGPIELCKLALRDKLPPELAKGAVGVWFSGRLPADEAKGQAETLEFAVANLERVSGCGVPMEPIYSTMQRAWAPIAPGPDRRLQWLRIDQAFVLGALEHRSSLGLN